MYLEILNTKRDWQRLNAIAKNAKQQVIDADKILKSINNLESYRQLYNEVNQISRILGLR